MNQSNEFDVSVIIPSYNSEEHIEDCLASVLGQKGVNVQVVLVDDCSTDGSASKARAFSKKHHNIEIVYNEANRGQAISRNIGIDKARARYVALLDSDDYYANPFVLSKWVSQADKSGADLCVSQSDSYIEETGETRSQHRVPLTKGETKAVTTFPEAVNVRQCWQILYRRDFLDQQNIRFSTTLRQREDRLFFIEAMLKTQRIAVIDLLAVIHRDHANSTMKRKDYDQLQQFTTHMTLLAEVFDHYRTTDTSGSSFERANAAVYWQQTFFYWNRLLEDGLASLSSTQGQKSRDFLGGLHNLTRHVGQISQDKYISVRGTKEAAQKEGDYDVARLCLEQERYDLLTKMLRGQRLHYMETYDLAEQSGFTWAGQAVTHYLRFNRNSKFESVYRPADPWKTLSKIERLVIHVGQPKTGSSAIQHILEESRIELSKNGILYPLAGCGRDRGVRRERSPGHALLFSKALKEDDTILLDLAAEIENQIEPVHTVILSAENVLSVMFLEEGQTFSEVNPLECLLRRIGARNVEIVGVFREPEAWAKSYYREVAGNPFNYFFDSPPAFLTKLKRSGLLDYDALKLNMSSLPQVGATHFARYEDIRAEGAEQWFLNLLGISQLVNTPQKNLQINTSVSDAQALKILLTKALGLPRGQREKVFLDVRRDAALAESRFSFFSDDFMSASTTADSQTADPEVENREWFRSIFLNEDLPSLGVLLEYDHLVQSMLWVASSERVRAESKRIKRDLRDANRKLEKIRFLIKVYKTAKGWRERLSGGSKSAQRA